MNKGKKLKGVAIGSFLVAVILFGYVAKKSKAHSYLSKDPKACINCHVMNTQYATWQHSSHKMVTCVECHLPSGSFVEKYKAKARDGFYHSLAFTLDTYDNAIQISDNAADRVQQNCINCHSRLVSTLMSNSDKNHNFTNSAVANDRKCWDCHQSVPHGEVRGLSTTLDNLGIKEVK